MDRSPYNFNSNFAQRKFRNYVCYVSACRLTETARLLRNVIRSTTRMQGGSKPATSRELSVTLALRFFRIDLAVSF